jgi:hypothetical protein
VYFSPVPVLGINAIKGTMKTTRVEATLPKVAQALAVLQTPRVLQVRVAAIRGDNTE